MSDSIDRVFVKAITTIRALSSRSNYGTLPRPPADNRIKLYGLYKQATEGNVDGVMPRPVGFSIEDEGAKKKWDAWKREEGLSKTEAKRRYISYLIDTMKLYASGTAEARELLSELEYLWDQIKDLQFTPEEESQIHLPSYSPSFSHGFSDRYSTMTPTNQQYRNNLQNIYSHSRRNTMMSINNYIDQQREHNMQARGGPKSTYSLPIAEHEKVLPQTLLNSNNQTSAEDFKNWQAEVNFIISKLAGEYLSKNEDSSDEDDLESNSKRLRLRIAQILKIVGKNFLKLVKSFSFNILAICFVLWCFKRNVAIKRTLVKHEGSHVHPKEYVISLMLKADENSWIIKLATILNRLVKFI